MAHIKEFEHLKISLKTIISATNNFSNESCIGKGGFGKVYKGEIARSEGHTMVALKRLDTALPFGQGDPEFWKEIVTLSLYKHENIVSLLGYCDDSGEKILVYEYVSKSSLERYLKSSELTWIRRLNICIGAARGLAYLHSAPIGTQQRVLHRDIKSSNILIDENWNAKISDFGLSKVGPANQEYTFLISHPVGTHGYCDPLYTETGYLTKESDVYSFGVVLFEVLCGRLSLSNHIDERKPLVVLVRQCYEQNKLNEIIYGNIIDEINPDSLKMFLAIAYQCLNIKREDRPLMSEVVRTLETALKSQVFIEDEVANMSLSDTKGNILHHETVSENTPPTSIVEYAHEGGGFLFVTIHEGKEFEERYPVIHVMLGFDIRRTTTGESKNPVWKEKFQFTLDKPPTYDKLHLTIGSSSWRDKYLYKMQKGHIEINLEEVVREKHTNKIYHLGKCQIRVELEWETSSLPLKTKPKVVQLLSSFYNVDVKKVRGR